MFFINFNNGLRIFVFCNLKNGFCFVKENILIFKSPEFYIF